MSAELMYKKKHIALSSFILLPTNICDSASVVAVVMMVPRLKRTKEEGSGSVVSLFPCRKTSTSTIQQLSDDMLFEIFCRLPCESAAKCKSVSKHWLSLISHLHFIPGYIRHHHQTNGNATQPFTLLLERFGNIVIVPSEMDKKIGVKAVDLLKFLPPASELHIEAAFNDLLLVCSNDSRCWLKKTSVFDYYICNPYTRHWLALPRLPPMTFASTPLVGFICDANFRYKVVRIHCPSKSSSANNNTTMLRVEIFSSETGEWCTSFVTSPPELNRFSLSTMQHPVVACNGMLHWLDIDVYSKTRRNKGIVVLNPQGCHLCYIDLPIFPSGCFISLGVFHGRIRIFQNSISRCPRYCRLPPRYCPYCSGDAMNFSVWELGDYANAGTWSLKHTVYLRDILSEYPIFKMKGAELPWPVKFIAFHPNDGDIVFLQLLENCIVSCNIRTGAICFLPAMVSMDVKSVFLLVQPSWPTPIHPLPTKFESPPRLNC
ncbi:F-box protein At5g07610-like [Quercus suber]